MNESLERIKGIVKLYNSNLYNELEEDFEECEKELKRLEKFDNLLKKYEIKSVEELEEIVADYDDMCKDIVEMTFDI